MKTGAASSSGVFYEAFCGDAAKYEAHLAMHEAALRAMEQSLTASFRHFFCHSKMLLWDCLHFIQAIPDAVFVAPTGAAARLIGGVTINSLFRIPPQPYITDLSMEVISNKGVRKTIKAIKVLVVDESSLVRSDIFAAIDYRLRQYAPDGCAKYRHNKLVKGAVCGIPRVLDAGQCNDCYSLAVIALKLKEIFGTADINELPISFDIAWYEQKAVAVLLALLHLGLKNIRLGPKLPAFYRRISRKLW